MRKIPTLYVRDETDRSKVTDTVTPGCEWVLAGEGVPTRKYDGTCVMLDDAGGRWWARREVKPGKSAPPEFYVVQVDDVTGKTVGWEPIEQSGYAKFHAEALAAREASDDGPCAYWPTGTYELCGPRIGSSRAPSIERLAPHHWLQLQDAAELWAPCGSPVEAVRSAAEFGLEGLVWHHPDGRMAKLKARDLR